MSLADGDGETTGGRSRTAGTDAGVTSTRRAATAVETSVPEGESPAGRCPYCDRPFRRERFYDLHIGVAHAGECTDAEADAYDAAHDAETDDLFVYHLKVVAGLVILFFGVTYTYAFLLA